MSDKKKPVIGVSGPDHGGGAAWFFTMIMIRLTGGKPVRITPSRKVDYLALDGIILGGGADVDPELYGEAFEEAIVDEEVKKEKSWKRIRDFILALFFFPFLFFIRKMASVKEAGIDKDRDNLELMLLKVADSKNLPLLGVCRGMQLINIFYKGSLYRDLSDFYGEKPQITTLLPKKKIILTSGSCLEKILGLSECRVNALHKQAVNKLGKGLIVSAREESGVVQAIEHQEKPFLLGVQWHPEYLIQVNEQRRIFKELIKACL